MHEFAQDEVQYDNSVSGEDAYEAALIRAGRTQHALILAEAQIISWKRRYVEAVQRAERAEKEVDALTTPEGVDDGQDEGSGAEAGGEADRSG